MSGPGCTARSSIQEPCIVDDGTVPSRLTIVHDRPPSLVRATPFQRAPDSSRTPSKPTNATAGDDLAIDTARNVGAPAPADAGFNGPSRASSHVAPPSRDTKRP